MTEWDEFMKEADGIMTVEGPNGEVERVIFSYKGDDTPERERQVEEYEQGVYICKLKAHARDCHICAHQSCGWCPECAPEVPEWTI